MATSRPRSTGRGTSPVMHSVIGCLGWATLCRVHCKVIIAHPATWSPTGSKRILELVFVYHSLSTHLLLLVAFFPLFQYCINILLNLQSQCLSDAVVIAMLLAKSPRQFIGLMLFTLLHDDIFLITVS